MSSYIRRLLARRPGEYRAAARKMLRKRSFNIKRKIERTVDLSKTKGAK